MGPIDFEKPDVVDYITPLKNKNPNFTLIDVGGTQNPFPSEFTTHTFDIRPSNRPGVHSFTGNMNDYESWIPIFEYVEKHGKFDFCYCSHTLEDIANPSAALRYMPKIAKEGFIAVPTKYYELQRRELYRGADHHRWIFDAKNDVLILYPKLNLIDYINYGVYEITIIQHGGTELRTFWRDDIAYTIANNDYMGPTREHLIEMFTNLIL